MLLLLLYHGPNTSATTGVYLGDLEVSTWINKHMREHADSLPTRYIPNHIAIGMHWNVISETIKISLVHHQSQI